MTSHQAGRTGKRLAIAIPEVLPLLLLEMQRMSQKRRGGAPKPRSAP